jgi:hypothetical protein
MMSNGNNEYVIVFQGVHNRVGKALDRPHTHVKGLWMSRPWMVDDEIARGFDSLDEAVTVTAPLPFQVSGGFGDFGLSLVVQFA